MAEIVTEPVLLDSTGQDIVSALNGIKNSVKPDATHIDMGPSDPTTVANAIGSINSNIVNNLQIPQRKITAADAATIDSIAKFNSVLADAGQYYVETNASIRTTFISLGLLPENLVGNFEARKIGSNYFFLRFRSYSNREWITTIDNGTLNAWQELALNENLADIGSITIGNTNATSISVPNMTATEIGKIVLTKGVWVVVACADWIGTASGYLQISFSNATNPGRNIAVSTTPHGTGKDVYQQLTRLISTNGETLTLYALQNSGGAVNCYPYLYAVEINNR